MAMHHRRHNPAGGANPFTGRSLPSRNGGGGGSGGGYHGNSPSLVPSMAKKAVFLVVTFTLFFYVMFAPEYDDVPYESNRPSIKKKESATDNEAMNTSFVDLSKKPQSEPVKLNLPKESTPEDNNIKEKEVESADYEDHRVEEEEDEEEGRMTYNNSNDQGDQSTDNTVAEDSVDTIAEKEEQLSPAEKIYGAHVHVDDEEEGEEGSKDHSQSDAFLGLRDESDEEEDEEIASNYSRGGLRGSQSTNNKDPFGRQQKTDDDDDDEDKKKEDEDEEVVETSRDEPVNIIEDKTFYKNQSPLEMPIAVVEDESVKTTVKKSMEDAITGQDTETKTSAIPCQDDPDFRYKGIDDHGCAYVAEREKCDKLHNGQKVGIVSCPDSCSMVNECLDQLQEQEASHIAVKKNETVVEDSAKTSFGVDHSEDFSTKEKAAFEAKYGSAQKSMEDELKKEDALESNEFKNHPSLEIPIVDASDVVELNNTEVGHIATKNDSVDEDSDNNHKSMADEIDKEDKDSNDEAVIVKKTEDSGDELKAVKKGLSDTPKVKTMSNDLDAEEKTETEDEDEDQPTKNKHTMSELVGVDTVGDSEVNEGASSVESDSKVNKEGSSVKDNFKEYLITNSEDEPNRDEKNSEVRESPLEERKDDEANLFAKNDNVSKDDKGEESDADEDGNAETHDETAKNNGGNDVLDQGIDADEDSNDKKADVDTEEDLGDNEDLSSLKEALTNEDNPDKEYDEEKTEDTNDSPKNIEESSDTSELGGGAYTVPRTKKNSTIVRAVDDESKDQHLSSIKGVQASNVTESLAEDDEEGEDADETLKKVRSDDASEKGDEADNDSQDKETRLISGATDDKLSNATPIDDEKNTAAASNKVDYADEKTTLKSNLKSVDNGDLEDESQEANTDLGVNSTLSDDGKETFDKSEGDSESVIEAKGNEDIRDESDLDADSKGEKKVTMIDSNIEGSIKESAAVKEDIDAEISQFGESEGITDESTAQNEDKKSLGSVDKKNDDSDLSENKDDVKYAKIKSDNNEPASNVDVPADDEKDEVKNGASEDSPIGKDTKAVPILGDLGEAIKESDEPFDGGDNTYGIRSSKLDSEATQEEIQPNDKGDKDEKSVPKKETDEEVDVVANTDGFNVDETAKIDRQRKEKE